MKGRWIWPVVGGFAGTGAIMALYLGLVTLTSGSWEHALSLLAEDRWFVGPVVLGFGIQAGLLVHLRRNLHARRGGAMAVASGGTSTAAMIACCAHHVTDVLPLLGFSGAAVFLAQYKVPFMVVGIVSNAAGIGVILRLIHRVQRGMMPPAVVELPVRRVGERAVK
jgi:hypothetical protein